MLSARSFSCVSGCLHVATAAASSYTPRMLPVFADPKTDFVFKRIFGAEARKPLLIALLNDLLELEGPRAISEVRHLPRAQHVDVAELKLSIVDVKCTDETGRQFVVEMQVLNVEGFEKRVVYNASKAYVMQLQSADQYPTLCDVVGVTICNFNLWTDCNPTGEYQVPMLSRWRMQEQHSGATGLSQVQYTFLELPKYSAGAEPKSLVDKWAYFFCEAKNLDIVPPALDHGAFRAAFDVARSAAFTAHEWEAYERAKMAEQDSRGSISLARIESKAEGKAEGKAESVLQFLEARGIAVDAKQRARILGCIDAATLTLWTQRAARVSQVEELWA
jgi:predicted transposase/invertase (TIGR01784 family)